MSDLKPLFVPELSWLDDPSEPGIQTGCGFRVTLSALRSMSVITSRNCWEYQYGRDSRGYGYKRVGGRSVGVHRLALELAQGPSHLYALHKCDNPPCCNPEHLYRGTAKDNAEDYWNPGRHGV